jgi:hypothetical protein
MKTLASALALLSLLAPSLRAQTFAQTFIAKSAKLEQAIKSSSLNSSLKDGFTRKLDKVLTDAKCVKAEKITCEHATPSLIDTAQDAADSLSDELADAIKADAGKSLSDLYKPKTDALIASLNKSAVDAKDRSKLLDRIAAFTDGLKKTQTGGKTHWADSAADAQDKYQSLADDVGAALQLSSVAGESGGFAQAFAAKAAKARTNISASALAAAFKDDFNRRLNKIFTDAKCDEKALKSASKTPCPGATPTMIESAQEALDTLSDDLSSAIASDGSKSLADVYKPMTDALVASLVASQIDGKDRTALVSRVNEFQAGLAMAARLGAPAGARGAADPAAAARKKYQALAADVGAALEMAAAGPDSGGFVATFLGKVKTIHAAIAASPLAPPFKRDFDGRLDKVLAGAKCTGGADALAQAAPGSQKGLCAMATASTIESAQEALEVLSIDLAGAIKADGGKSLADVYKPKTDALTKTLQNSTVDATDRTGLIANISAFQNSLDRSLKVEAAGASGGADPAASAQDRFDTLTKNVNAAIELSPISPDAAALDLRKLRDLSEKLIAASLPPGDGDARAISVAMQAFSKGITRLTYADARDQLAALNSQIDDAIARAPASVSAYAMKTSALEKKLSESSVDSKGPLMENIGAFSRAVVKLSATDAKTQFQALQADVDGAIALSPISLFEANQYRDKIPALDQKILYAGFVNKDAKAFTDRVAAFTAKITSTRTKPSATTVEAAKREFDALSSDVDAAIVLLPIRPGQAPKFMDKIAELAKKLDGAKVAPADQKPMKDRFKTFSNELIHGTITVADAESELAAISTDVDLTIQQLGTPPPAIPGYH